MPHYTTYFMTDNGKEMTCSCDPDVWEGDFIEPPCDKYEDNYGRCNLCGHALLCHIAVTLSDVVPLDDLSAIMDKIRCHFE